MDWLEVISKLLPILGLVALVAMDISVIGLFLIYFGFPPKKKNGDVFFRERLLLYGALLVIIFVLNGFYGYVFLASYRRGVDLRKCIEEPKLLIAPVAYMVITLLVYLYRRRRRSR